MENDDFDDEKYMQDLGADEDFDRELYLDFEIHEAIRNDRYDTIIDLVNSGDISTRSLHQIMIGLAIDDKAYLFMSLFDHFRQTIDALDTNEYLVNAINNYNHDIALFLLQRTESIRRPGLLAGTFTLQHEDARISFLQYMVQTDINILDVLGYDVIFAVALVLHADSLIEFLLSTRQLRGFFTYRSLLAIAINANYTEDDAIFRELLRRGPYDLIDDIKSSSYKRKL